jgi:hypothetical protein
MKYYRKTQRKKRSKRRLTSKNKGGARGSPRCSRDTPYDRFVATLWSRVQYALRDIDDRWLFDQHENRTHRTCNLWGWLRCHSNRDFDTHWDLFFRNINEIGLSLTFENAHNYRNATFRVNWDGIYDDWRDEYDTGSQAFYNLAADLASWIDNRYWGWVGWRREDC